MNVFHVDVEYRDYYEDSQVVCIPIIKLNNNFEQAIDEAIEEVRGWDDCKGIIFAELVEKEDADE